MSTIAILNVKFSHTSGGAEILGQALVRELEKRNHEVHLLELPLVFHPKESLLNQVAFWRSFSVERALGKRVDLIIATKFPTYYIRHSLKSIWLIHQHRQIYDLFGTRYSDFSDDPRDEQLRHMLTDGDIKVIGEADYVSAISATVANRLHHYCDIDAAVLYPPLPLGSRYYNSPADNYILSVGRLVGIKRVDLAIKALSIVHPFVKLRIVGIAEDPLIMDYYRAEINRLGLSTRVEFLGRVSDEELLELYSRCLAVYYAPYDEDYGFVTLEAFASAKPVITASDSGGTLEFVRHMQNGLVLSPDPDTIGHAINSLIANPDLNNEMGRAGRQFICDSGLLGSSWDAVINSLLSPIGRR